MSQYRVAMTPGLTTGPPQGKRFPFCWPAFTVTPNGEPPTLQWEDPLPAGAARLRLTVALDDREIKTVQAVMAQSGETLGTFDLRYSDALQTWEIPLTAEILQMVQWEGIALRMVRGSTPLYVFCGAGGDVPESLRPHLMFSTPGQDRWAAFQDRLCSLDSIEMFGWHEGCVLDGLLDLRDSGAHPKADIAVKAHLDRFLPADGGLIYEDPRSETSDGRIYGIEATLPFAAMARVYPEHPLLRLATVFWRDRASSNGSVTDGKTATAEGAYTVAYPMAVIAKIRQQEALMQMSLFELRLRRDRLVQDDNLFLRFNAMTGERTFKNWARGAACYLLGLARCLILFGDRSDITDLREEYQRAAAWALSHQKNDLWPNYLDDPKAQPDTAASVGIAAALALGAKHGLLEPDARLAAARTLTALTSYLTPDGLLAGAAQSNKGGETLQRSPYRVIKKTTMGLAGVLIAALKS